jgi:hypothetical protein
MTLHVTFKVKQEMMGYLEWLLKAAERCKPVIEATIFRIKNRSDVY